MASLTSEFETFCGTKAGITSLASGRFFTKRRAPQGTARPFVILKAGGGSQSLGRLNDNRPANKAFTPLHVWACADTDTAAFALAEAIRLEVEGFRGAMGTTNVSISPESFVDEGEEYATPTGNDKPNYYFTRRVYRITHDQSTS